jgi:hypothetical protein
MKLGGKDDMPANVIMELAAMSKGNPGALTFLVNVMSLQPTASLVIMLKIVACKTLRGTDLYVLWSDLCNKDMERVVTLCTDCPDDILMDACSRQDRSGKELVKPYLP